MILLDLPYPPSLWDLYRGWGKGRNKTVRYKTWIRAAGNEILATPRAFRQPIVGHFTLCALAGRPDKRLRDLDNIMKACCDLLQAHNLVENDCRAQSISVAWSPHVEKRRIELRVWPFDAERAAIAALPLEGARGRGEAA